VGLTVGVLVLVEMALVVLGGYLKPVVSPAAAPASADNTKALGLLLYTDYVYAFEIAAVILLVAIVAAIALTHRTRKETKHQDPGEQVKVRARDRLRVLSMPSEKREG
jgi:NADH-quinone oxidoreductase subunit J